MAPGSAYDDREGFIWMDGNLVEWRAANVHILTHALHYASAVFEGERAYGGTIFRSEDHSRRLLQSGMAMDIPIPYTVAEIEEAKAATMRANDLSDAYVRVLCWRGSRHGGRGGAQPGPHGRRHLGVGRLLPPR